MALKLFNTLTRSVQEFAPLDPAGKHVGLYCCGPTVYDLAHIGNFRTFVFADLVRRFLEFKGYAVRHVMNITDVEDKIIRRVRETGEPLGQFTRHYEDEFRADLKTLNCLDPHETPRATAYIAEMIALIAQLIARRVAYRAADGSVYFSIEKYRGCGCTYGQLVKLNFDEMRAGERVSSDEYEKESLADFALWKARVPDDGAVFWPSPWGEGRPGWHIECSAMSMKLLGTSFDIHMGGEDLMFPHHEDEIAQSEGALAYPPGERFVKYWLHGAHLLVEGKKMSKSLGNYFTLRDLLAKGFTGREIRYLLLTAHYRESFNFTLDGLTGARTALARIDECIDKLRELSGSPASGPVPTKVKSEPKLAGSETGAPADLAVNFAAALDDDLNISAAWGAVFEWVREINRSLAAGQVTANQATASLVEWRSINSVLGLKTSEMTSQTMTGGAFFVPQDIGKLLEERKAAIESNDSARVDVVTNDLRSKGWVLEIEGILYVIPSDLPAVYQMRESARQSKDFKRADAIRNEFKNRKWLIEDTPKGPKLKRV